MKTFTLKEFSEKFHKIESLKDKMLEADPNLEKSMITCQDRKDALSEWRGKAHTLENNFTEK